MKFMCAGPGALLAALTLLPTPPAAAGVNTVFNFLRNDVNARAGAMAGSFVSVMNDPNVIFYNPGALATLDAPRGSAGFFKQLLDINSGSLSYGQELTGIGWVGAGVVYTNYGSFTETDDLGNQLGTFHAGDLAFMIGYANVLEENLTWGVNAKFIYSSIAGYTSSALAGDVGILYNFPESHLTLGASIRNVGSQLSSYAGTREDLPLDVTVGASIIPRGLPLLLNLNFHNLNENTGSFSDRLRPFTIGGEFTVSSVIQLRFGYNNEQQQDLKVANSAGLAGFSLGLGVTVSQYRVDYGISSLGKIGSLHRVTISSSF